MGEMLQHLLGLTARLIDRQACKSHSENVLLPLCSWLAVCRAEEVWRVGALQAWS